ncbi:hypothetical protein [Rugosimonospora africana]|uniref:Uncharacterized protein n=1 Tax=Rugosimonospora africana TaxID=556532 RepID=A0A8J3QUI6_9ACTN|nr:hypothetical protein [Rugosimonospora africana]GIH16741.1 hypothetical protein Raf01_49130 [Rugosimonospora africana]
MAFDSAESERVLGEIERGDDRSRHASGQPAAGRARSAPTGWQAATWAALVLTATYLATCLTMLIVLIRGRQLVDRIARGPSSVPVRDVLDMANIEVTSFVLYTLALFAYIAGFVAFFVISRRMLRRLGYDARTVMSHWSVAAWRSGILVSLALAFAGRTTSIETTDPERAVWHNAEGELIFFFAVRVAVAALLICALWMLRKRISSLIMGRPVMAPAAQSAPSSGDLG